MLGQSTDPVTLNRYTYANNNPLTNADPTGHYSCPADQQCGPGGLSDPNFWLALAALASSYAANRQIGSAYFNAVKRDWPGSAQANVWSLASNQRHPVQYAADLARELIALVEPVTAPPTAVTVPTAAGLQTGYLPSIVPPGPGFDAISAQLQSTSVDAFETTDDAKRYIGSQNTVCNQNHLEKYGTPDVAEACHWLNDATKLASFADYRCRHGGGSWCKAEAAVLAGADIEAARAVGNCVGVQHDPDCLWGGDVSDATPWLSPDSVKTVSYVAIAVGTATGQVELVGAGNVGLVVGETADDKPCRGAAGHGRGRIRPCLVRTKLGNRTGVEGRGPSGRRRAHARRRTAAPELLRPTKVQQDVLSSASRGGLSSARACAFSCLGGAPDALYLDFL